MTRERGMNERYGLLGTRPLPFPLWCKECGAVVADSNAHDKFHAAALRVPAAEKARVSVDNTGHTTASEEGKP